MNNNECKRYIKKSLSNLIKSKKVINPENIGLEMDKEINDDKELYIAYAKVAVHNLCNSANNITINDVLEEVDIIPRLYSYVQVIHKANTL